MDSRTSSLASANNVGSTHSFSPSSSSIMQSSRCVARAVRLVRAFFSFFSGGGAGGSSTEAGRFPLGLSLGSLLRSLVSLCLGPWGEGLTSSSTLAAFVLGLCLGETASLLPANLGSGPC